MKLIIAAGITVIFIGVMAVLGFAEESKDPFIQHKSVRVNAGQDFTITTVENPTTGCRYILEESFDKSRVKFNGSQSPQSALEPSQYKGDPNDALLYGAGHAEKEWIFTALKPGKTTIVIKYVCPGGGESILSYFVEIK